MLHLQGFNFKIALMSPIIIAGPCAAESREQLLVTARQIHDCFFRNGLSLTYFRAGVWKPRSQPDDFVGAGSEALPWLKEIEREYGFSPCVEIARPEHIDDCLKAGISHFWIGSRTSVNPFLVQELADALRGCECTIMVKNPVTPDLKLWMGDVERFAKDGRKRLIAIHRGFSIGGESIYRNAPEWQIPIEFKLHFPEIPLVCDPSHLTGNPKYFANVSQIALDYGFDGLMIETHSQPAAALSDAKQQISPQELVRLLKSLSFKSQTSSPAENALRKQRTLLNNVDTQIRELLQKRMQIVDRIADIKQENNLPLVQPAQWNKVVENYHSNNTEDTLFQDFIDQFLELLHQHSIERQKKKQSL